MRIGLIADTHVPAATYEVPYQVMRAFKGVDMILHGGDIYAPKVLDVLHDVAPVYAVPGGGVDHAMDDDPRMAEQHILTVEGVTLGLTHVLTLPGMHYEVWPDAMARDFPRGASVRAAAHRAFNHPVDVVVFGDTHFEMLEWHDGVLFVNAGSPTLPRQMMKLGHVAILEIRDGKIAGKIVDLNDYSQPGRPDARYI